MASLMSGDLQYGVATLSGETDMTVGSLTITGGITASATQTIDFGSNSPIMSGAGISSLSIPDSALSLQIPKLYAAQTFVSDNTFSATTFFSGTVGSGTGLKQCGVDAQDIRIGDHALYNFATASKENIAVGYHTLYNLANTSSNTNVAVGHRAGESLSSGDTNTFIGGRAGRYMTSGTNNLFFGADCGSGLLSGASNFAAGQAMVASAAGGGYTYPQNNVAIGGNAFAYVGPVPQANNAIGAYSLYNDTGNGFGGLFCTAIGGAAGVRVGTNMSYSVFIGGTTGYSATSPAYSNYTYCTCIGVDATAYQSHSVELGTVGELTFARGGLCVPNYLTSPRKWIVGNDGLLKYTDGTTDFIKLDGDNSFINITDVYATNLHATGTLSFPSGSINSGMTDSSIITSGYQSPYFQSKIILTHPQNSIIIGDNNTSSTPSNSILIGYGAARNLGTNDMITSIGVNSLFNLTNGNGFENMAMGTNALYWLTKGNYNTGMGSGVGSALAYSCYENTFVGHNIASTQYTKPITYILWGGATLTGQTTLTLSAIPAGLYAGCRVNTYYNGTAYEAPLTSFNNTTFVLTLGNSVNITAGTYIYFYEREYTTDSYTTAGALSGTSFTIASNRSIYAGQTMAYKSTATLSTTVGVVSYNSSSGALVVSSSITVVAGSTMYFMYGTITAGNASSWGSNSNNNTVYGSQSLSRICTGTNGNTIVGQNAMSANDSIANKIYCGGANNTAVGYSAGTQCWFKSNNNTFIGANADILTPSDTNNITHATAIGADAKVFQSNTIMLGTSNDTVHIPAQINIRTQYLPFAVSTITGSVSLTAPFYGTYIVNTTTTPITVSLPAAISGNMVGMTLMFRRINNANVVNVNLVSGTNVILTRNASASTVGTALNSLLPATQYAGTMTALNGTTWAIIL